MNHIWSLHYYQHALLSIGAGLHLIIRIVKCAKAASNPNYNLYMHRLSVGWFGILMDNSDSQYAGFRNKIPILFGVMLSHFTISRLFNSKLTRLGFSIAYLCLLFGASVFKLLAILLGNYAITMRLWNNRNLPIICWIYCVGTMLLSNYYDGFRFGHISDYLAFLDSYNGLIRWHISFNLTVLKMISFTMDYYWMLQTKERLLSMRNQQMDHKQRVETALEGKDYNIFYYLTYCLYAPLFLSGPIITYNDFVNQLHSQRSTPVSTIVKSLANLLALLVLMEIMIHSFHVVAIKDSKAWMGFSLTQLYTMGYLNLYLVWLKLMIIWRFFRLWALTDNIETVENMTRCISANYSAMDFWKAWHVSYNRWLIRYVYVPLGGKKYYAYNIFPIFLWVGVWHGVEPHLLAWGLLIAALILPEFFCTRYFCQPKVRDYYGDWHLHICAAGGVINLLFMISTNLIGFVLGIDGFLRAFDRISIDQGLLFFVMIFLQLFCFVHCTFWEYAKQAEGKEIVSAKRDKRTLTGSSIFLQREE